MSGDPVTQETLKAVPETHVPGEPAEKPTKTPAEPMSEQPIEITTNGSAIDGPAPPAPPKDEPATATDKANPAQPNPAEAEPPKPEFLAKNPALSQFFDCLPTILENAGYAEIWGVSLKDSSDPPTANVMIKFLRANDGVVKQAEVQLTKALEWRKKFDPLALVEKARFSSTKFGGLGYITTYKDPKSGEVIFTWNIYGSVKSVDQTFGDVEEFIKWRVTLMELAVKDLKINESTTVIDYDGVDPYQIIQVHDYQNVSFLRMNPTIRSATRQTIEVFSTAYPELLREKFFVNVPTIMGWMFTAMKVFLSKNTTRKFHPISNGANLAREFPAFSDDIPKTYGGKSPELKDNNARTVPLVDDTPLPALPDEQPKSEEEAGKPAASNEPKKPDETAKDEPVKEEPAKEVSAAETEAIIKETQ
ncbi:CRAL-TRIO domain containing protein [Elaphomyces granulatus]